MWIAHGVQICNAIVPAARFRDPGYLAFPETDAAKPSIQPKWHAVCLANEGRKVYVALDTTENSEVDMRYTKSLAAIGIFLSTFLVGCASNKDLQFADARTAMEQARAQNATEFAPVDWDKGMTDWNMAMALVHMDRYAEAKSILVEAAASFNRAREISQNRRDGVIREVTGLRTNIGSQYADLKLAVQQKGLPTILRKRVENSLPWLDIVMKEMDASMHDQRYLQAREEGYAALGVIYDEQKELAKYVG